MNKKGEFRGDFYICFVFHALFVYLLLNICQKSYNSTPPIYQILMAQTSDDRCLFVRMYQLPGSSSAITKIWRWNSCWTLQRNSKTHRRKNGKGVEWYGEKTTRCEILFSQGRNMSTIKRKKLSHYVKKTAKILIVNKTFIQAQQLSQSKRHQ